MAGARKAAVGPLEPKVPTAAISGGVVGGIVVLIIDLVNREPLDQTALTVVLTAVVSALVAYGAGYLKTTPLAVLTERRNAAVVNAGAGPGTQPPPFAPTDIGATDPTKPADPPTPGAKP